MLTSSSLLSTSSTASGHSGGQIGRTSSGSFKFPSPQYRSSALVQKSKVVDVQEKEVSARMLLRARGLRGCGVCAPPAHQHERARACGGRVFCGGCASVHKAGRVCA